MWTLKQGNIASLGGGCQDGVVESGQGTGESG